MGTAPHHFTIFASTILFYMDLFNIENIDETHTEISFGGKLLVFQKISGAMLFSHSILSPWNSLTWLLLEREPPCLLGPQAAFLWGLDSTEAFLCLSLLSSDPADPSRQITEGND